MASAEAKAEGPKFPGVSVQLTGGDGNAMSVIGKVAQALRRAGHGAEVATFMDEAMSGDYNPVLQTCMAWVDVS